MTKKTKPECQSMPTAIKEQKGQTCKWEIQCYTNGNVQTNNTNNTLKTIIPTTAHDRYIFFLREKYNLKKLSCVNKSHTCCCQTISLIHATATYFSYCSQIFEKSSQLFKYLRGDVLQYSLIFPAFSFFKVRLHHTCS